MTRDRYLMFSTKEWEQFKDKLHEKERQSEKAQEKSLQVKKMIEDSLKLTKDWDDTYERILAKQEEERERKKLAQNESRMIFYKKYLEQKQQEREAMLAQAEDFNFRQRDEPKTLMSSLMCSEALRQVAIQRKFNEKLRAEKREEELQYAKEVAEHARAWDQIQYDKYMKRRTKNLEVASYIKQQYETKEKDALKKKQEQVEQEKEDIINANREMEELKEHDRNTRRKYAAFVRKEGQQAIEMVKKRRHENKVLDEMEDKMIEVYLGVTCKIKHLTNDKIKNAEAEKQRYNELIRNRFPRKEAALLAKEEINMKKAQEEYERKEIETINIKKAKVEAMNEDKRRCHQKWMEQQAVKKQNEETLKKWEIANRLENEILTEEFLERERLLKIKQMKEYTDFLDQQKLELKEKKQAEKEELYDFYHTQKVGYIKGVNDKFVDYSTKLIAECKQAGRPTRPLEKVVADYKAKYMAPPKKIASRYLPQCPRAKVLKK